MLLSEYDVLSIVRKSWLRWIKGNYLMMTDELLKRSKMKSDKDNGTSWKIYYAW